MVHDFYLPEKDHTLRIEWVYMNEYMYVYLQYQDRVIHIYIFHIFLDVMKKKKNVKVIMIK